MCVWRGRGGGRKHKHACDSKSLVPVVPMMLDDCSTISAVIVVILFISPALQRKITYLASGRGGGG